MKSNSRRDIAQQSSATWLPSPEDGYHLFRPTTTRIQQVRTLWPLIAQSNSTTYLPFKEPQIPSNRDHKALNRGTGGGLGRWYCRASGLKVGKVSILGALRTLKVNLDVLGLKNLSRPSTQISKRVRLLVQKP